jgi:hypothetical protein
VAVSADRHLATETKAALAQLQKASRCARDLGADLQARTASDTPPEARGASENADRRARELQSRIDQICLALGEARARLAGQTGPASDPPSGESQSDPSILRLAGAGDAAEIPRWDRQMRVLRVGAEVVKFFRQPSCNQEAVLSAFEEEGWPLRIDDPLQPLEGQDSMRRLNLTIWRLNKHQRNHLIRFFGDGTGQGICWELLSASAGTKFRRAA